MFIAIEGPRLSFKSTIISELKEKMRQMFPDKNVIVKTTSTIDETDEASYYLRNLIANKYDVGMYSTYPHTRALMWLLKLWDTQYSLFDANFIGKNDIVIVDYWILGVTIDSLARSVPLGSEFFDCDVKLISDIKNMIDRGICINIPDITIVLSQHKEIRDKILRSKGEHINKLDKFYLNHIYDYYSYFNNYIMYPFTNNLKRLISNNYSHIPVYKLYDPEDYNDNNQHSAISSQQFEPISVKCNTDLGDKMYAVTHNVDYIIKKISDDIRRESICL